MDMKIMILFIALIAGCMAIPKPESPDFSVFFDQSSASRIVGGDPAPEGSAPHMVALTSGLLVRSFSCGASIISARTVLTAAHCIDPHLQNGELISSLRGIAGTNRWNIGGVSIAFERYVNHPDWTVSTIKNDIGLLITSTAVDFTETIAAVPLSFEHVDGGLPVRVTGWGRIVAGGSLPTQLLELYKLTISGDQCVTSVADSAVQLEMDAPHIDPQLELCTFHSEGYGVCNGDSGSALLNAFTDQQIGIVSWGFPCALGAPDMYVRVSTYRSWLIANVA